MLRTAAISPTASVPEAVDDSPRSSSPAAHPAATARGRFARRKPPDADARTTEPAKGRTRLEALGIWVAVFSAIAGLFFNSVQLERQSGDIKRQTAQARLQTDQARAQTAQFAEQTREFGLDQLGRYYVQVTGAGAIARTKSYRRVVQTGVLSDPDNARLSRYLRNADYVAWLLNRGQLRLSGADGRLSAGLRKSYLIAKNVYGSAQARQTFHELAVFVSS